MPRGWHRSALGSAAAGTHVHSGGAPYCAIEHICLVLSSAVTLPLAMASVAFGGPAAAPSSAVHVPPGRALEALLCDHGNPTHPLVSGTTLLLEPGTHTLTSSCTVTDVTNLTIRGAATRTTPAVISGGFAIAAGSFRPVPGRGTLLSAAIPPGTWGDTVPQQVWVSSDGQSANNHRRTRARHPNLFKPPDGRVVDELPYMYWAEELCPLSRSDHPGCALPKSCAGANCDQAACNACVARNRFGFRYNATASVDVDVMRAVNVSAAAGELQASASLRCTVSCHRPIYYVMVPNYPLPVKPTQGMCVVKKQNVVLDCVLTSCWTPASLPFV